MESLEEILKVVGGLVVGAIYLFGNQIFKSKGEDESRPPTLPRESGGSDDTAEDYAARQRQIQEAIRRKIQERRQASSTPASSSEPVSVHRERHKHVVERQKETQQQQRAPQMEATPAAVEVDDRFSWDESDNAYEAQMQERLQQIEVTKRRAEALKRQAGRSAKVARDPGAREHSARGGLLSGSVRSVLRNPRAARTAFVYGEVLGKPVALRSSGSGVGE